MSNLILWALALQVPLSMGFPTQQYWSGLPCPPPEDLPDSEIESTSHTSPALASSFFATSATWQAPIHVSILPQLLSHAGCHISLSRVPCAIQEFHVAYPLLIEQYVHVHPKLPNYSSPSSSPSTPQPPTFPLLGSHKFAP